eukprot:s4135_g3.t1
MVLSFNLASLPGMSAERNLASKGSTLHGTGRCSPCAWFWKSRGCNSGWDCTYCHIREQGESASNQDGCSGARGQSWGQHSSSQPRRIEAELAYMSHLGDLELLPFLLLSCLFDLCWFAGIVLPSEHSYKKQVRSYSRTCPEDICSFFWQPESFR